MEDFINSLLSSGPVGIVSAAVVYLVIYMQRSKTGKKRDENEVLLKYRVQKLEESHDNLSKSIKELQDSIISLQISVNRLVDSIGKK
jgi:uncharacterized protein YlxW (UPF0749 family)